MKNIYISALAFALSTMSVFSQATNEEVMGDSSNIQYKPVEGLMFNFDNNNYQLRLNGFFQPYMTIQQEQDDDFNNQMAVRRARLNFYGKAAKEKISFKINLDYTDDLALLDAWMGWHPGNFNIYFGQRHNQVNNREMNNDESRLTYLDRSIISESFSQTGREFGLFIEPKFTVANIGINPTAALTSGDGRNAFGANSTDRIKGGFKYSGRLDVLPLGQLTNDGEKYVIDIYREESPKLVVGVAGSRNVGASDAVGEGTDLYGTIVNDQGESQNPNYDKLVVDLLFKFKGISFLGEYMNTRAQSSDLLYSSAGDLISTDNISSYYALGTGLNFQVGYFMENGFAFDVRTSFTTPEFEQSTSVIQKQNWNTLGVAKYSKNRTTKVQLNGSYFTREDYATSETKSGYSVTLMTQVNF